MEQDKRLNLELIEVQEKVRTVKSILLVLENDLSSENGQEVYFDVVKVTHDIVKEIYNSLSQLLQTFEESL